MGIWYKMYLLYNHKSLYVGLVDLYIARTLAIYRPGPEDFHFAGAQGSEG